MTQRINAADLHQRVGEILARIRYTGERFIIERRGKPIAAIIPVQDLEQLRYKSKAPQDSSRIEKALAALEHAAMVSDMILARRKGKRLDSAKLIREMREERARHVAGLR